MKRRSRISEIMSWITALIIIGLIAWAGYVLIATESRLNSL